LDKETKTRNEEKIMFIVCDFSQSLFS